MSYVWKDLLLHITVGTLVGCAVLLNIDGIIKLDVYSCITGISVMLALLLKKYPAIERD